MKWLYTIALSVLGALLISSIVHDTVMLFVACFVWGFVVPRIASNLDTKSDA